YNPIFNGVIVAVLAVGILVAMFQVARLNREIRWLQAFSRNESAPPPRLLAPLARQLTPLDHRSMQLTPTAARAILDGVQIRLDEQRDLTRYLTGLLVFLG
ncbi:flagellar motor protein MotA, partial [Escherichia coli]